jgi:hypothetical protein
MSHETPAIKHDLDTGLTVAQMLEEVEEWLYSEEADEGTKVCDV